MVKRGKASQVTDHMSQVRGQGFKGSSGQVVNYK